MIVRLIGLARTDSVDAAECYEARRVGLGEDFLDAVFVTSERIGRQPRANGRVYRSPRGREVRETLVDGFPFRLVYEIVGGEVFVLSITHARAKSQPWRRRLPPAP